MSDINTILDSGLTGLAGLGLLAQGNAQLASMPNQNSFLYDVNTNFDLGNRNYGSFDQINNDMNNAVFGKRFSTRDVLGRTDGQQALGVASNALSGTAYGATAGSMFGPVGTAIGAGAGLLIGAIPSLFTAGEAKRKASIMRDYYNLQSQASDQAAITNYNSAYERLNDNNNRLRQINVSANGGKVEKKPLTLKEFADKVLSNQNRDATRAAGIIRQHKDGGTVIRIKKQ